MDQFVINRNKTTNHDKTTNHINTSNKTNTKAVKNTSEINVYTDGACIDNGKPYARAGYGIWFGENDPRNTSESYNGKQTNNIAELLAIIKALTILDNEIKSNEIINIYSDSRYAIRCCTTYGEKCYKKNWINPNNKSKPIPNLELVQTAYLYCRNHSNIRFHHVAAHTNRTDQHSIGNDHADRLANKAAGVEKCPYSQNITNNDVCGNATYNNATEYYLSLNKKQQRLRAKEKRIYLNVPYNEKDEAKKLGAKWESAKKSWYILDNNKNKELMMGRW
jgi:ribonuclease HI